LLPGGVTAIQLQLMLAKAAKEYPEVLNQEAVIILTKVLLLHYRCKPGEKTIYEGKPN
jgi:hypothetical protein